MRRSPFWGLGINFGVLAVLDPLTFCFRLFHVEGRAGSYYCQGSCLGVLHHHHYDYKLSRPLIAVANADFSCVCLDDIYSCVN